MAQPMEIDSPSPEVSSSMMNIEQTLSQPRCPYRNSSSSNSSQFRPPHSQHPAFHHHPSQLVPNPLTSSSHFNPNQLLPNPTWNYSSNHPSVHGTYNSSVSRFPSVHYSNHSGRPRDLPYFDNFHTQGDGRQQSHPPLQTQQMQFQESRSLFLPQIPSQPSTMSTQNTGTSGEGPNPTNRFSVPPVASSSSNPTFTRIERLNGGSGSNPDSSNSTVAAHASDVQQGWGVPQYRHLPPPNPNSNYDPYRLVQGMPYPNQGTTSSTRPNGNSGIPSTNEVERQGRTSLPPPRLTRERAMPERTFAIAAPSSAHDWRHEAAYVDFDSDDSLDDDNTPPSSRPIYGDYRASVYEHEERLERERAARRAQAASVKFVASATALASFEKVDVTTLGEDEKSCIICYNDFGVMNPDGYIERAVRLPKCKHVFGDHCIKQWLKDSDSCPYCRDKLPSEPKQLPGSSASNRENLRRILADGRHARMLSQLPHTSWGEVESTSGPVSYEDSMASISARHNAFNNPEGPLRGQEMFAILRRELGVDVDYMHRSMPDHDGGRNRRNRGRHSIGRMSTQTASTRQGGSLARVRLNHQQQPPTRAPVLPMMSFDGGSTSQQRSITPHPAGLPTWTSSPIAGQPTSSGRPSSLPNERSPLGQATENSQTATASESTNSPPTSNRPTSFNEDNWSAQRDGLHQPRWMAANSTNGRPASAEFLHEMPGSRQIALEGMFGFVDQSARRNQNSGNQQPPQSQPNHQDNEFHQQFPQQSFWPARYSGGQ